MEIVVIVVLTVLVLVLLTDKLRRIGSGPNLVSVESTLEKIREVGDLCVLKAHIKEIVTLKSDARWHTSDGKMALICSFEIEFRYDLRKVQIESIGKENAFRLTIPPHFCKVIPDKIEFYHEEKRKLGGFWPEDFTVDDRNEMINRARQEAVNQAQILHESIEGQVQEAAKATLRAIGSAFGASSMEFRFGSNDKVVAQIREGMERLAA
jgi:hypothetical protein